LAGRPSRRICGAVGRAEGVITDLS
jgi:hypothetical protein